MNTTTASTTARQKVHQQAKEAFKRGNKKGIIHVAMRVGKTKIALDILQEHIEDTDSPRILILYPDNKIQLNWEKEIKMWGFGKEGLEIHFYNYVSIDKVDMEDWDAVVFDEIHATSERQRTYMQELVTNTPCVLGLTGTLSASTEEELAKLDMLVLYSYSVDQAVQDGIIAPYFVYVHMVKLDNKVKTPNSKGKLVSEKNRYDSYTYVIEKLKSEGKDFKHLALHRNRVLQNSIAKRQKTLSLLKEYKEERVLVFTGLKAIAESLDIPFYHSTSGNPEVFQNFVDGKIDKMAVVNIGRAGITFKDLDNLIINSFTGNEETTEQIVSRVLNKEYDGKIGTIHIICSDEEAELKKLNRTLSGLDQDQIKYV